MELVRSILNNHPVHIWLPASVFRRPASKRQDRALSPKMDTNPKSNDKKDGITRMLTTSHLQWTLRYFKICSQLKLLPFRVNSQSAHIVPVAHYPGVFALVFLLLVTWSLFLGGRLIQAVVVPAYLCMTDLPIHVVLTAVCFASLHMSYKLFILSHYDTCKVFNTLVLEDTKETSILRGILELSSIQELAVTCLPVVDVFAKVFLLGLIILKPAKLMYITTVLGWSYHQHSEIFVSILVEAWLLSILFAPAALTVFILLAYFQKLKHDFDEAIHNLRRARARSSFSVATAMTTLKTCQELHISVGLFNCMFADIIFVVKIVCMFISTALMYSFISLVDVIPELAVVYGGLSLTTPTLYVIMFDHAFGFPARMVELKNELLILAERLRNSNSRKLVRTFLKSVQPVAIKVGSFRNMERTSTPDFVDFVLRNIVSLLVVKRDHA